ncbi:putative methylesterase 11, chloroplastic [Zingiber officinale]|uniref:putative methylesterase 11, chloroplastic n=1 Tax=Zingiber officinale TaxID=94328 RepID=UPI001C4C6798|nr:putative methylesterase 11, chloroplastic [Zingiber officinale]
MGVVLSCFSNADLAHRQQQQRRQAAGNHPPALSAEVAAAIGIGSEDKSGNGRSERKGLDEAVLTHEQALAAVLLLRQNGGAPGESTFDKSSSLRVPGHGQKRQVLPRSSSSRPRSLVDPVMQPQLLVNQDLKVDNLETKHFVLVHGGGFGAWCWYKSIALLEDSGFKVSAIDLTGSGISSFDTNKVTSLAEYAKPLTSFLETLGDMNKVILVGHDFGGACVSYAMEVLPSKVAKSIFICAAMPINGQNILDMFSEEAGMNDLMRQAQVFVYSNGQDLPPTAIDLDKSLLKELLFNQSPSKDVALALVSMRSIPFAPVLEKLSLTEKNYGSVRRFFIETTDDNAMPLPVQQRLSNVNPPEKVFRLKGSDHSPFFSKPQALHKILVEIATMPSNQS